LKLAIAAISVAALVILAKQFNVQELFINLLDWIENLGVWAPAIFIGLYIIVTVFFLPGSILTLGAGVVFGVVRGSIYVSVAATLGATAAFLVGRYLARDWVAKLVAGKPRFSAVDRAIAKGGWRVVGLLRLAPAFPFNLLNYGLGITQVSLRDYFFASWIGMIPGTIMYVYFGSLAGDLVFLGSEERSISAVDWAIYLITFVVVVTVTIYVTKLAQKELNAEVLSDESKESIASTPPSDAQASDEI